MASAVTERALTYPPPAASMVRRLAFLVPLAVFARVAVGLGIEPRWSHGRLKVAANSVAEPALTS
jgi:hypothetical protein